MRGEDFVGFRSHGKASTFRNSHDHGYTLDRLKSERRKRAKERKLDSKSDLGHEMKEFRKVN